MNLETFLTLRRHLKIVHHVPGRIRLRIAASIKKEVDGLDKKMIDQVLGAIDAIKDVRINAMAGTVIIQYTAKELKPAWWETLVNGEDSKATSLLERLLQNELASAVEVAQGA